MEADFETTYSRILIPECAMVLRSAGKPSALRLSTVLITLNMLQPVEC